MEITDEEFSSQLSSLPQTDVVALQAALEWAACSKQAGSTGVVAVSVDGGEIFLVLEVVHVVVVPLHPASRCLQMNGSVGVHGGLQELASPQVPEEHQSDPSS